VQTVAAAAAAEFVELKPVRRVLLVLRRYVIALFALGALQYDVISRHRSSKSKLESQNPNSSNFEFRL
jgi:hypothetical protein